MVGRESDVVRGSDAGYVGVTVTATTANDLHADGQAGAKWLAGKRS